jgi:SAM-dependent methyltransferase
MFLFPWQGPLDFLPIDDRLHDIHLDFGCGTAPRNPFEANTVWSVDVFQHEKSVPTHLIARGESLPFESDYFSSISAFDVLEHLSRDSLFGNEFIFYMNEFYRVLKPGGLALFIFPAFPFADAFSDPTHVNFITRRTVDYFLGQGDEGYAGIDTKFELILNKPLRFWNQWFQSPINNSSNTKLSLRRRISLAKRSTLRAAKPQHRLWLLSKPKSQI